MLRFEEALERVVGDAARIGSERVATAEASGRVLAEDLRAEHPQPATDYSAMDGYAIATASFAGAGPWELPVRGEAKTGEPPPKLLSGSTCRIFTGATLPEGADAVVMQENVERSDDRARFGERPREGANVRRAGEDLKVGELALAEGTRLGPFHIGCVASLDRAHVAVAVRPRVTVVCTGDELRSPGDPPFPGSLPESNGVSIAAAARHAGADARLSPLSRDDEEATRAILADALAASDVVVTVGGVSVGDYDVVKPALEGAGVVLDFWKVAIKPGKPLVVGRAPGARVLGVPGNPVSAQVTFSLFGIPLLRKLQGDARWQPRLHSMTLGADLRQKPGRRGFYRATVEGAVATPLQGQSSGSTLSMARADALVVVPEDSEGAKQGDRVEVLRLDEL